MIRIKHNSDYLNFRIFTLIELLVVCSMISILLMLLLPALKTIRSQTERIECVGNMDQIGILFNSYAADHNGVFPAPMVSEYGNYWSNILHSLYESGKGLEFAGTGVDNKTKKPAPKYVDNIYFTKQGSVNEVGTIFHCPSALKLKRLHNNFTGTAYQSYVMNPNLSANGADYNISPKLSRITSPSTAYLSMDCNNGIFMDGWSFWYYSSKTMTTFHHDEGRNFLYVDGHVNYIDNLDIPRRSVISERNSFWYGL